LGGAAKVGGVKFGPRLNIPIETVARYPQADDAGVGRRGRRSFPLLGTALLRGRGLVSVLVTQIDFIDNIWLNRPK
jgi:hypothetical protein